MASAVKLRKSCGQGLHFSPLFSSRGILVCIVLFLLAEWVQGEQCPDVSHCFEVCGDRPHHNSQCSTTAGRGEYTAECCEGTGKVCPEPPCGGSPAASAQPSSSKPMEQTEQREQSEPVEPSSESESEPKPSRSTKDKKKSPLIPPLRLRPSIFGHDNSMGEEDENPFSPFQHSPFQHSPGGVTHIHGPVDLAKFLHSLPLFPAHPGGMSPFRPTLFNQNMPSNPQPGEEDCSHILVVQLKEGKRSSGLRDDITFSQTNCYQIKIPEATRTLKLGVRTLSPPNHDIPDIHSAMGTWPRGRKVEVPHWQADDDDVSYATIDVAGRGDMYLKISGVHGLSLDYQLWFVQIGEEAVVEEGVWYGTLEKSFVSPAARVLIGMYLAMGAGVGLSLSQPAVQVRPKTLPLAYAIWLTFGILGGHRFYLNRTASAIIWYFTVVGLILGLTIDLSVRSGWSDYLHHHALWGALLALTTGGLIIDGFMIPVMAKESTYWERSFRKRKQKGKQRRRNSDDESDGYDRDVEDGTAQLDDLKNQQPPPDEAEGAFNIQADIPQRSTEAADIRERHREAPQPQEPATPA